MGYIVVKPRDAEKTHGFQGVVFVNKGIDKVIDTYEEMGGPSGAQIIIVREEDGYKVDVQVHEPKAGEGSDQAAPQELP